MSDSEPSDAAIEQALRDAVRQLFKSGKMEDLTLKRVRKTAEEQLHLENDRLKNDAKWKDRSKEVVGSEVSAQEAAQENGHQEDNSSEDEAPKPAKSKAKAQSAKSKSAAPKRKALEKKKPSAAKTGSRKRQKVSVSSDEEVLSEPEDILSNQDSSPPPAKAQARRGGRAARKSQVVEEDSEESADESAPVAKVDNGPKDANESDAVASAKDASSHMDEPKTKPSEQKPADSESELSELVDEEPAPKKTTTKKPATAAAKADDSESELSELIDDEPAPRKKATKKAAPAKGKTAKAKANTSKANEADDSNAAEIKRLQGWLVKCGIRKLWGKELKPYETPKAKINHLKGMLKDAGMDGRYSVEKARQIKEQRELAADLEAVQEGAKMWGQESEEEQSRPRRRLAKGLKDLEGLVDEDGGEETD